MKRVELRTGHHAWLCPRSATPRTGALALPLRVLFTDHRIPIPILPDGVFRMTQRFISNDFTLYFE
jgi:hypothetical protein